MAKEIDYITLDETPQDILSYQYSLEAYDDRNRDCSGCRTRNKEDLKSMYQLWKELYGTLNLKYTFKKGEKVIEL